MLEVFSVFFSYSFLVRAVIVGSLVSICCALLGVPLVLRRYSMIGDGLSHVGFGALAVAMVMNAAPLKVAIPVVVIGAILLLRLSQNSKMCGDAGIAVVSVSALAIGVIVISLSGGLNGDVYSYMFGSILTMSSSDVLFSAIFSVIVIIAFILFYSQFFIVTFDETFSRGMGLPVGFYNLLLAVLTAVTIVVGMRLMGTLLISGLIVFPALSSMRLFNSFLPVLVGASVISVFCFFWGVFGSYCLSLPAGASIVVVNLIVFVVCCIVDNILPLLKKN